MSSVSISKGVFVYKNGFKLSKKHKRKSIKSTQENNGNIFANEMWYQSYITLWNSIESKIQNLNKEMFSHILSNLVAFIKSCYRKPVMEIPAATLLTGINMPDHGAQFTALAKEIKQGVSPHVAILHAPNCNSLKALVENLVNQLINIADDNDDESDEEGGSRDSKLVKKTQCSFALLQSWYEDQRYDEHKPIAVIIPHFESFNKVVLQDFMQIASSYMNTVPFVLIFGVATSLSVLHKSLPYHVSSKVNIQVFHSQPSTIYLNNVLENVFFTDKCPFHLGGKLFTLFMDIFLFYDFSVTGFVKNFKYAMLEHFSTNNARALCVEPTAINSILNEFTHEDFECVRRLLSFRRLVESETYENRLKLLEDDDYFCGVLESKLIALHKYLRNLHVLLHCLQLLVADLPKTPLGKQIRELYIIATSRSITETSEFKEAFQLLSFQSKDELTLKLKNIIHLFGNENQHSRTNRSFYNKIIEDLNNFLNRLLSDLALDDESSQEEVDDNIVKENIDRRNFRQALLENMKKNKSLNKYERVRQKIVHYFIDLFKENLVMPSTYTFHEIFFFNDVSVQGNIIGSHRAAMHTALNDPNGYLQCDCCVLPNDAAILNTLPDICIVYKLHLEYGKMINLYDWLQAFLSIVDPVNLDDEEADERKVDPRLQARFTQCVAELEYLGFIKSSKRKVDHVARLTWGG